MLPFKLKHNNQALGPITIRPLLCLFMLCSLLQGCPSTVSTKDSSWQESELPPIRAIQVDLDYVYDPDPVQQQKNLELLGRRVGELGIDTVFLQAFADPDGNGVAESLYFPSRLMPLRQDLFASAARLLRKNGVAVYGWLPLLSFRLPEGNDELYVARTGADDADSGPAEEYLRLSPFNNQSREIIEQIYRDFSSQTAIDGILFHDDGVLSDFEDASTAALQQYQQAGFPADIREIHGDSGMMRQWSRYKSNYLIDFSLSLIEIVRRQQPAIRSARNIFAGPVLNPDSEIWFAQSLPLFLQAYDYSALMAMPYMEEAVDPDRWLRQLAWTALALSQNSNRIIFELQSQNWRSGRAIDATILQHQITLLARMGVTSFAYYPDDFHKNMPPAGMIRSCFSKPMTCAGRDDL